MQSKSRFYEHVALLQDYALAPATEAVLKRIVLWLEWRDGGRWRIDFCTFEELAAQPLTDGTGEKASSE